MLFRYQPLLDQQSADWIFSAFDWALTHFDADDFFTRSQLVEPTLAFFPNRVNSVDNKAQTVFKQTQQHAGLEHWPFELQAPQFFEGKPAPAFNIGYFNRQSQDNQLEQISIQPLQDQDILSHDLAQPEQAVVKSENIVLSYHPAQTTKSEDLCASFAHLMAQHLTAQLQHFDSLSSSKKNNQRLIPGGKEYFGEATEVLAIFMGFGIMFANSAYSFRGGCGSCYNPAANRKAALNEDEVIFAMALYGHLKGIKTKTATYHLKSHLKGQYKKAIKQIKREPEWVERLLAFKPS